MAVALPGNVGMGIAYIVLAMLIFALLVAMAYQHHTKQSLIYVNLVIDIVFCISMYISGVQALGLAAANILPDRVTEVLDESDAPSDNS